MENLNSEILVLLINLDRAEERRLKMERQLSGLGIDYVRISAIDGKVYNYTEKEYDELKYRRCNGKRNNVGEIGCYMAHIKCWKQIVSQRLDFGVIWEDDVILSERISAALKILSSNLGRFDFVSIQNETKKRWLYSSEFFGEFSFYEFVRTSGGFWGYVLSQDAAKLLLDNLIPFGITVDTNVHLYYKYKITVKSLFPPVVFHRNGIPTERKSDKIKHVRNFCLFARQVFQLKSYIGKLRYFLLRDGFAKFLCRIIKLRGVDTV